MTITPADTGTTLEISRVTAVRLRTILLDLARSEDDLACADAAAVPYWAPKPASVSGHRAAARALRGQADRFLEAAS